MTKGARVFTTLTSCRVCNSAIRQFLEIGASPIANRLLASASETAETYPLGLSGCDTCGLVQNSVDLPSDTLFGTDYPYLSSVSAAVRNNAGDLARQARRHLAPGASVLDVGSNDGTQQLAFRAQGFASVGVDPSGQAVERARQAGLTAYEQPFGPEAADRLLQNHGRFDAVTMSNVLAHVADPLALLRAAHSVLEPSTGLLVAEVQSWRALVDLGAFDMVYHEHFSHFSLSSLLFLLSRAGFSAFDVTQTQAQGGSLRVWCRPGAAHDRAVSELAGQESRLLVDAEDRINASLRACRQSAPAFTRAAKGRRAAGYGAAAKSVTLLAALGSDLGLTCIADRAPTKIGRHLPYGGIPIQSPAQMLDDGADIILLFAWNLAEEILPQLRGRETWVPFPEFRRLQ